MTIFQNGRLPAQDKRKFASREIIILISFFSNNNQPTQLFSHFGKSGNEEEKKRYLGSGAGQDSMKGIKRGRDVGGGEGITRKIKRTRHHPFELSHHTPYAIEMRIIVNTYTWHSFLPFPFRSKEKNPTSAQFQKEDITPKAPDFPSDLSLSFPHFQANYSLTPHIPLPPVTPNHSPPCVVSPLWGAQLRLPTS